MKNYTITVNGNVYEVSVEESNGSAVQVPVTPVATAPKVAPKAAPTATIKEESEVAAPKAPVTSGSAGSTKVSAPMPGKILGVKVSVGQQVKKGDVVVILEAMKMENEIVAPQDGIVASVNVAAGQSVESGEVLATLN